MKKLYFAAIGLLIVAGCGESAPPDPKPGESADTAESASAEKPVDSGEPADESKPVAEADAPSEPKMTAEPGAGSAAETDPVEVAEAKPKANTTAEATDKDAEPEPTIADKIASIEAEKSKAMEEFRAWYDEASAEEKAKNFQEHYPDPETYAARVLELATDAPKDSEAEEALMWVANNSRGASAAEAVGILLDKHGDNEKIADTLPMLAYGYGAANEAALRKAAEAGKSERVKALGTLALAQYLQRIPQMKEIVETNPQAAEQLSEHVEYFKTFKADNAEIRKLYTTAVEKYGSISTRRGTIADSAEGALFELNNLQVGMAAPDIEGADLDGTEFKLSDYKGKVVLLDFWGNW